MTSDIVVIEADPWDPSDVTVEMLQSLIDGMLLHPVTDPNRPEWITPLGEPEPRPRHSCGPIHAGAPALLWRGAPQLQPQLHRTGGHLRCCLRGVLGDCSPLGVVAPSLLGGAYHQADGHVGHEEGGEGRRLHSPSALGPPAPLHPGPARIIQSSMVHELVLSPQRRRRTSPYTGRIVGSCPERWKYGVPREDQPKLQPLLEGLQRLRDHHLTAAVVVAAFHSRRVLR